MKAQKYFGVLVILALLFALVPAGSVSAAVTKVAVCHLDDMGIYHLINISEMAFPAHVEHGDASPLEWIPGKDGYKFGDDCSLVYVEKYTFVQSVPVSGLGTLATSQALTSGQAYELRASGIYKYSSPTTWIADAKCSLRVASVPPYVDGWVDGADLNTNPELAYGLQVTIYDGDMAKPLLPVGWVEPCNLAHEYTATYVGTGFPLSLLIWDNVYGDNTIGTIVVGIYQVNW